MKLKSLLKFYSQKNIILMQSYKKIFRLNGINFSVNKMSLETLAETPIDNIRFAVRLSILISCNAV